MNRTRLVIGVLIALGAMKAVMGDAEAGSELASAQKLLEGAKLSMVEALQIAQKHVQDAKPLRAELQLEDGQVQYEVTMLAGRQRVDVEIDAVSGKVLEVVREAMESNAGHRWNFDKDPVGAPPPGWVAKENNPTKALATWVVEADPDPASQPNVLNVKTGNDNATYNLLLLEKAAYKDLNLTVKVRGNTGEDDQGGGLIWRCRDDKNYYVCRINPIENNYRVYKVVDGKRTQLQSADFETPAGQWFTLRVRMEGNQIACYCDGKKWLEVKDDTFKDAGMIGLWTKADASTSFDDLRVWPLVGLADGGGSNRQ